MRRLLLLLALSVILPSPYKEEWGSTSAFARKVSTALKNPDKSKKRKKATNPDEVTIIPEGKDSLEWSRKIVFSGYDKQAASSEESFFVSNNSDCYLKQLRLRITYLDLKGRMLHQRDETVKIDLPPGETRKVDIKSFDRQRSFYHILSNRPSKRATPFDTRIEIISLTIKKEGRNS